MAGTIREEIAAAQAGIAALGVQNARFEVRLARVERALASKPSTERKVTKVAAPRKAIKATKRGKRPSRRTPCNLNGCSRLFFSSIGANDHRCR